MYTLLHLAWITNKDLLCSTESSSQHSVMAYLGKESLKKKTNVDICICTTDSLCYTTETNTTLLTSYAPI